MSWILSFLFCLFHFATFWFGQEAISIHFLAAFSCISFIVRPRRATTLAVRWIVGYARQRREKTMAGRLAAELLDASNGVGAAMKRKEDLQKMAESNKAFAHYRW